MKQRRGGIEASETDAIDFEGFHARDVVRVLHRVPDLNASGYHRLN